MDPTKGNILVLGSGCGDTIQYQLLTTAYLTQAVDVLNKVFFRHGNFSKAVGVPNNPMALDELCNLGVLIAKYGVTVIAVEKETDRVVGVAFNRLATKNERFFENALKSCKETESKIILKFLIESGNATDLFAMCQAECLLEIVYLVTEPDRRGRGIATKLGLSTLNLAKRISKGENVKRAVVDGEISGLDLVPEIVTAVFTSSISQRIGKNLGFKVASEKSFNNLMAKDSHQLLNIVDIPTVKAITEYKRVD